jgi:hypothetical protein
VKSILKRLLSNIGFHLIRSNIPVPEKPADLRTSPATKVALAHILLTLQSLARSGSAKLPHLSDSGFRIFSQFEEDGYLLYLVAVLELENKLFLDIGSADGINSNCANLALNLGWHGLFIDGDTGNVERGRAFFASHPDTAHYPPLFKQAHITAENINSLVREAGFTGDIGICSIDIDGNDCWVWKALDAVSPAVIVIETHIEFGMRNIAVPYDPDYRYPGKHPDYHGASVPAMCSLATQKGYRLVGANRYGFNLIFVRNDIYPDRVPAVPLETVIRHPRYAERLALFEPIKSWDYTTL